MAGPGLLVSVGYMDPGNWATDIEAGSKYGFTLPVGRHRFQHGRHALADAESAAGPVAIELAMVRLDWHEIARGW